MKFKKIVIPKPYEAHTRTVCDFCGHEVINKDRFDASDITIQADIGRCYPESDNRKTQEFDCCVDCWTSKIVPALKSIGGKVYERHTDESREMPLDEASR